MNRAARLLTAFALSAAAAAAPLARAQDAPNPLRGSDLKALLDTAAKMKTQDARGLGRALHALGEPAKQRGVDLDLLVEFAVRETSRPLRTLAVDAARRIDPAAAAAAWAKKAAAEKDPVRQALAIESLAHVGTKEHAAALIELVRTSPSEMVATAAADALARLATPKDVEAIFDAGLAHAEGHVTDHTAWTVQDLLKKPKLAVDRYQKVASKKGDPRSIRADSTVAMLQDRQAEPHEWGPTLDAARKLLLDAPDKIEVKGEEAYAAKVRDATAWLRDNLPAEHWLVCAAVKGLEVSPAASETMPDFTSDTILVKIADTTNEKMGARQLAYLIHRQGVVLFRKRIGEPYRGHRGWEPAIFDSYDVCVVAKLYQAGPGGLSRERFLAQILERRPWGTQ